MEPKQTLKEQLTAQRLGVSVDEYQRSRTLPPRQGASWGIWGDSNTDLTIFDGEEVASRLRKDVVLIGANFGLHGEAGEFRSFQNFHASTGGDTKLRKALTGTVLEGAFLTDLVKDYPSAYATGLPGEIKNGTLDIEKYVVSGFLAEQEALGLTSETLYIPMGAKTRELWNLLDQKGAIPAAQRVFHREYGNGPLFGGNPVANLTHYSAAVNMAAAVEALLQQKHLV
ncbi:hypothetical protein [Microbacterium lacticum]